VHALDKRDHPLEPDEGAGELQLISPDRDLRIGGGQGLKAAAEQGCLVFCAEGGRAFKENECKWPMWRACKNAGLRRISWHVLRHTFPSHLVMKGVPLKAVQELMSHATIE
jgi:site-specific recombinase XerD